MKKRILMLGSFMALLLSGCANLKGSTFNGSKTSNENSFEISFEILNTTYTHEFEMTKGENILVHIEKKSGDIKVVIKKENESPVYEGNGDVASDFAVKIQEDGVYTVSVTGNKAKGRVTFNRK